jgi:hypothetical protein
MKRFYIPHEEGTLEENKVFIPSLAYDNHHLPESYIEMLKELPSQQRERLLNGNWRYTDDINALFKFEDISASAYRHAPNPNDKKYISVDVARFGSDTSVAVLWVGLTIVEILRYKNVNQWINPEGWSVYDILDEVNIKKVREVYDKYFNFDNFYISSDKKEFKK